ncbi:Transcription factor verF [Exophiala dermatitidis]
MAGYAGLYICQICSKSYKRPEHLRRHQVSHGVERPHRCRICGSTFQRSDVLKRHLKTCDAFSEDPAEQPLEPSPKRPARRKSPSPQQPVLGFPEPSEPNLQYLTSNDPNVLRADSRSPPFANIAGWISGGLSNHAFDDPSENWQDFLNWTSGTQRLEVTVEGLGAKEESLQFLANFTSNTGLAASFDCGTLEQRWRVADAFAKSGTASTSPMEAAVGSGTPVPDINEGSHAHAAVHHWLSDPLSLKSHEIVTLVKEVVMHKSQNSCVGLTWSPSVQQACVQFFSPGNIRRCLYFYWAIWHPNVNIVHKPTFDPLSSKPQLVAAMVVIGACVSPERSDLEEVRRWFNCVEEMVFSDDDLCNDGPSPVCRDTGEVQWRHGKLRALQAAYMVCLYQNWEGSSSNKRRIRRHRYSAVVATARDIGISNARHPDYQQQTLCDFPWSRFALREELIRVFMWIFLLDTAFVIFNNLPPRMVIREMRMSTAMPEACFQAMTAEECFSDIQQGEQNTLDLVSAFEILYQPDIDSALILKLSNLGPLNLFALASAFHSIIFHFQNTFSCQGSLEAIKHAQQAWKTVWDGYMSHFSQVPRHSPTTSTMADLVPDDMWKRAGFTRYASEYWLLGKYMVDRLSKPAKKVFGAGTDPDNQVQSPISAPELVSPLLSQYDETSMQQVNMLISEFRNVNI